jgi:hypothetical protein
MRHVADRRQLNEADATEIADAALSAAVGGNPMDVLRSWADALLSGAELPKVLHNLTSARQDALRAALAAGLLPELDRTRVPDQVRVVLRRSDGSEAGSLDGGLSVGQRCTAVLAILLADGDHPVLIDQPEDEIANEFIYQELVPMIRTAREHRQVVLSTHDPNLPVNGDAELIVALDAVPASTGTRGRVLDASRLDSDRAVTGDAIGALDRPAVKLAVEEIMEGSEAAFRRRLAKYGF